MTMSNTEALLQALLNGETVDFEPKTRIEQYLKNCCDMCGCDGLPAPRTNVDALLYALADKLANGGSSSGDANSGIEPLKAFEPIPNNGEVQVKSVVPMIDISYSGAYTNSSETLSVEFDYGEVGDVHIACAVLRTPTEEPTLPDGWRRIAWIEPLPSDTTDQWLLIAKYVTTADTAGTTGEFALNVVNAQRNYIMILNLGDSDIDEEYTVNSSVGIDCSIELYENTLVVCSSVYGAGIAKNAWAALDNIYLERYAPAYNDSNQDGARLSALYVPYSSHQLNKKLNLTYSEWATTDSHIVLCALKLKLGTSTKYICSTETE